MQSSKSAKNCMWPVQIFNVFSLSLDPHTHTHTHTHTHSQIYANGVSF